MKDRAKTKEQLTNELAELRQRIPELEALKTKHKRIEKALLASAQQWQRTFDAVGDVVCLQSVEGRILRCNTAMANLLGKSFDEIKGRTCWELMHGTSEPIEGCPIVRMQETHHRETFILPRGDRRLEGSVDPLLDENGNLIGAVHIISDVTEHKQAEEALLESQERYRALFEDLNDAAFLADAETGRILDTNKQGEVLLGRTREEIIGMHQRELHPPEKADEYRQRFATHVREGHAADYDGEAIMKNGSIVPVSISAAPVTIGEKQLILGLFRDITERKQAEEALRESEKKYKRLFKATPIGITTLDMKGMITSCNPSVYTQGGYSEDDLVGKHFSKITPIRARDIPKFIKVFTSIIRGEVPKPFEVAYHHKDGTTGWTEVHVALIKANGKKVGILVLQMDITERKKAEEALRESQERYRALVNLGGAVGEAIVMLQDTEQGDAIQTFVNREWPRITGYSRKELLGMSFFDLLHPRYRQTSLKRHKRKVSGEAIPKLFEMSIIRKGGTEVPIEITSAYSTYKGERANVAFIRDITERKQAEEALRQERNKAQKYLDIAGVIIVAIDAKGVVTLINKRGCEVLGYPEKEIVDKNWFDNFIPPRIREEVKTVSRKLLTGETEPAEYYENSVLTKDGEEKIIAWYNTVLKDEAGNIIGHLSSGEDITERKQAEERERRLQQELYLSSRLASIGQLAAGVAHQINNPLTGILGFSERLLRKSTDKEATKDLERIHNEAARTAKIIQSLLTFARRHKPKKEYADINDILQKALELRAYELKTGNIEVALDLAPDLPQTIADFNQIEEVFLNLILNAEQAMTEAHRGGKLIIKTQQTKDYIRISFADDGPGIPAKYLDKLFDPFFTTREERGGSGLGLSVCHGIVTEHGGKIYAKSKSGKGSTFFVELPVTTAKTDEGK